MSKQPNYREQQLKAELAKANKRIAQLEETLTEMRSMTDREAVKEVMGEEAYSTAVLEDIVEAKEEIKRKYGAFEHTFSARLNYDSTNFMFASMLGKPTSKAVAPPTIEQIAKRLQDANTALAELKEDYECALEYAYGMGGRKRIARHYEPQIKAAAEKIDKLEADYAHARDRLGPGTDRDDLARRLLADIEVEL